MSKRKTHNLQARIARSCRSLLASNHVAVVNIDPSGRLQAALPRAEAAADRL